MTLSSTTSKIQYTGNGSSVSFSFPYVFFVPSDLSVTLFDTSLNQAVTPAPVLNGAGTYDYTVSGTQDAVSGEYLTGAAVVFNTAPLGNHRITVARAVAALQQTAFVDNSKFPASAVNAALDRLTMLVQQVISWFAGALQFPASDPAGLNATLPPAVMRAGMSLGFDAAGNVIAVAPIGHWRGAWASGTVYAVGDVVQDGAAGANTGNLYYCLVANTGGTWAADLAGGDWSLAVNVAAVTAAAAAAAASATTASGAATTATTEAGISTTQAAALASANTAAAAATTASGAATTATTEAGIATTQAGNASTSATAAAASAGSLTGTSTTSLPVATGSTTFATQAGKTFASGWITAQSAGTPSASMSGLVTSYTGTNLVLNVVETTGAGTHADWNLSVAGGIGATGPTGASGSIPIGTAGGTVNAITVTIAGATASDQQVIEVVCGGANTSTTPTLNLNSGTAYTITARGGQPLVLGDIGAVGFTGLFEYNAAHTRWELQNPCGGTAALANTGTSGATVPLLNGNNIHSGTETFAAMASMSGAAFNEAQGTNIASASTTAIGAATGNYINITGTTTITAFDTVQAGTRRKLNFNGAVLLTYNATSLILPGAANYTTAAGDMFEFTSLGGGNWACTGYALASGKSIVAPSGSMTLVGSYSVGTGATFDVTGLAAGYDYVFMLDGIGQTGGDGYRLYMRMQTGGSTWQTSGYRYIAAAEDSTSGAWNNVVGSNSDNQIISQVNTGITAVSGAVCGMITLINPANTSRYPQIQWDLTSSTSARVMRDVGTGQYATGGVALTGLRLYWQGGYNFAYGTVNVYKIAKV